MKAIKETKRKTPLSIKLIVVLVFIVAVVSFELSLKYAGENKIEYPELKLDVRLHTPECLIKGGFYEDAVSVSLNVSSSEKIYYTLDGSEPSLSSAVYSKPIVIQSKTNSANVFSVIPSSTRWKPPVGEVFKGTTLRAISVDADNNKSTELIRTFFVDEKGKKRYSLPVIAITVNQADFFGYEDGIYVMGKQYEDKDYYLKKNIRLDAPWWEYPSNYLMRGSNSERPIHIEFYDENGNLGFEQNAGARISGNATRGFSQKSLRVCFDKKYGIEQLSYKIFPNNEVTSFNSLILRNAGNDWTKTMFRDAFMQSLMSNSNLETQDYRPAIVFINGEYWGVHNIRERVDENYLANKYKMSTDSIVILQLTGTLFYGKKNDQDAFSSLLDFIKSNDLSQDKNYEFVEQQIDITNFMDFIISNVYFCNSDWPNNNVKFWRCRSGISTHDSVGVRDGRWRWILYDTDWGFGYTGKEDYQMNLLEKAKKVSSIGVIFGGLLKNKAFSEKFISRFDFHITKTFDETTVISRINEFEHKLKPEMQEHINRWRVIGSNSNWESNVEELRDFAKKRPAIQKEHLKSLKN